MPDYLLRNVPDLIWEQLRKEATMRGLSIRSYLLTIILDRLNSDPEKPFDHKHEGD